MEKVVKAIQDEYPDDFAWCYGCGRLNQDGYHFRTGWLGEKQLPFIHLSLNIQLYQDLYMADFLHH